jgi:peptidoglycan-associated lipoprotein
MACRVLERRPMRHLHFTIVVGLLLTSSCTTEKKPSETAADRTSGGAEQQSPDKRSDDGHAGLEIDPRIREQCGFEAAYFEFDSALLHREISHPLDQLAECFGTGPLAGKSLKLVGHADPRGETEYNYGLGQRRAGSVAAYLERKGLAGERISAVSRGEVDARGNEERGWSKDRRVEVLLDD